MKTTTKLRELIKSKELIVAPGGIFTLVCENDSKGRL